MIDHMGFRVRDLAASRRFYEACAEALELQVIDNTDESFLIGRSAEAPIPFIWVGTAQPLSGIRAIRHPAAQFTLASARAIAPLSMRSTEPPWLLAAATTARQGRAARRR